jgi:hypothetical protein
VSFRAVPVFANKIRIARAGKNFRSEKNAGIFLFRTRKVYQWQVFPGALSGPNGPIKPGQSWEI